MAITYEARYLKKMTSRDTQPFRSARLFSPGGAFPYWWRDPERYLKDGAYISTMSCNGKLKGIAIINCNANATLCFGMSAPEIPHSNDLIGFMGFFVSRPFRGCGYAVEMAKTLESLLLKLNPQYLERIQTPLVTTTGRAVDIGNQAFKYIKPLKVW